MTEFFQFLQTAIGAPTAKLLIVFGLLFLGVAIVGSITGRISPGPIGRILGGLTGPLLILVGLSMDMNMHLSHTHGREAPPAAAVISPSPVPTPKVTASPTPKPSTPTTVDDLVARRQSALDQLEQIQDKYDRTARAAVEKIKE